MLEISPFGFVYIILMFCVFLYKKERFENLILLYFFTELNFGMGYAITTGSANLQYSYFSQNILVIYCLLIYFRKPFRIDKYYLCLSLCCIASMAILAIYPSNVYIVQPGNTWDDVFSGKEAPVHPTVSSNVIGLTIRYLLVSFVWLCIYKYFNFDSYRRLLIKSSRIVNLFLIFGLIELVVKNIFGMSEAWGEVMESFFGSSDYTAYEGRDKMGNGLQELTLFTRESSFYVYTLFINIVIKFSSNVVKGYKNGIDFFFILGVVLCLLSTSISAVINLFIFGVLFYMYRYKVYKPKYYNIEKKGILCMLLLLILGGAAFLSYWEDNKLVLRLRYAFNNFGDFFSFTSFSNVVMDNGDETFSTQYRIISIVLTFFAAIQRPIFGYSIGSIICHGSTMTLFSNIGLLGIFFLIKFFLIQIPLKSIINPNALLYTCGIILFFSVNMFVSLGVRPFYDFSMFFYVIGLLFLIQNFRQVPNDNVIIHK